MFQHLSTMPFLRWDNGMSLKEYVFFEGAILYNICIFISNSAFQRRCDLAERREFLFKYNTKHFTSKRYRISLSCVFNRTAFKMKTRLATLNRWSRKSGKTSIVTYKLLLTGTCSLKVDEHTWNPFGVRNNTLIAYLLKKHVKCGCSRNRQLLAFVSFLKSVYVYEIEPHGKILRQKKMTTETRTHLQFSIPWTSAQWKSHCY